MAAEPHGERRPRFTGEQCQLCTIFGTLLAKLASYLRRESLLDFQPGNDIPSGVIRVYQDLGK